MHQPIILPYQGVLPTIHPTARIAVGAVIIGNVIIGAESNIWYGCVLRGDDEPITIGKRCNIQDGTIIHVNINTPTMIGDDVSIGHMALIHATTIESSGFVGMKAIVLDGSRIESHAMLAAGGLLTPRKIIPKGELWAGSPAKKMRNTNDADKKMMAWTAPHYVDLAKKSQLPTNLSNIKQAMAN
ncbi:MAG: gamma carbonic anhydrase family protein [Alphaproteobacteria bacterium]